MATKKKTPAKPADKDPVAAGINVTWGDVRKMRKDYADGMAFVDIAVKHKVGLAMARDICTERMFRE